MSLSCAEYISKQDKDAVLGMIGRCMGQKMVYIDPNPKYHSMTSISEVWKNALLHSSTDSEITKLVLIIYATNVREYFESAVNLLLRKMFSHFTIKDANHVLHDELERDARELGFTFQKSAAQSVYQEYQVLNVTPGGPAHKNGIRAGDRFYLPNKQEFVKTLDISHDAYTPNKDHITWNIFFYEGNNTHPKQLSSSIDYSFAGYLDYPLSSSDKQVAQFCVGSSRPIVIKVSSFKNGSYNGKNIATLIEYAIEHNEEGIVIDLRGNSGGHHYNYAHLMSYFIPYGDPLCMNINRQAWLDFLQTEDYKSVIFRFGGCKLPPTGMRDFLGVLANYINDNKPNLVEKVKIDKPIFEGNVAVLIDKESGSSAECAAGTLKAVLGNRCRVIGQKSMGGVLSNIFDPSTIVKGFLVNYPGQEVLMLDGRRIEEDGIEPDDSIINVGDINACLQKAREWFITQGRPTQSRSRRRQAPAKVAVWIDTNTLLINGPYDNLWGESLDQFIDLGVSSIEGCPNSNLCLIHLEKPDVTKDIYARYFGSMQDVPEHLSFYGHDGGYVINLTAICLYGIKDWNPQDPTAVAFTQEVNDAINQMIIAQALKSR